MSNSKVKRENYITIQGFMLTDLHLKGNELIIYACIYGFSQAENQAFTGSLQYLADWTNSTKQGVVKNLKSLGEKGYIVKEDKFINGVKFCEYHTTEFNGVYNKNADDIQQSLIPPIQQSLPNIISLDKQTNTIKDIIDYLNKKTGLKFKATSKDTQKHINARLAEGFTVDDFKIVIDKKVAAWTGTEYAQYLRPSTLFGTKFESYLNAPAVQRKTFGTMGVEIDTNAVDDLAGYGL